ncbi:MAG TPA: hypothetical protein VFG68_03790, partial [Fimbriiglobus sp.]|nr:hypothetical protein [Fimbriiglobus sp.]
MIDATATTALFADLAFRGWFPKWLAVAMGVLAVAAVVLLYLREAGRVPAWRRAVMAGLRAATLASVLLLLLRPTLLTETRGHRPRPVAVLVDDSQSMTTRDPRPNFPDKWRAAVALDLVPPDRPMPSAGDLPAETPEKPTRLEVAKAALTNPRLQLLEKLKSVGPLQPASFGLGRSAKDPRDNKWVDALAGTEPRTALVQSVFDLLNRDENEMPAAVVLVTDGRENASQQSLIDLARECARLEIPIHVYGVGSSSFGQVQIRG